jgi:hypothetical protein
VSALATTTPNPLLVNLVFIVFLVVSGFAAAGWRRYQRSRPTVIEDRVVEPSPDDAPPTALDEREATTGVLLYQLMAAPTQVIRRVETIEFLGADSARRRVSIDFEWPNELFGLPTEGLFDETPVTLVTKDPLKTFDIFDEDNRPLPVASTERAVSLAQGALRAHAGRILGQDLHDDVVADLMVVPGGDKAAAKLRLGVLEVSSRPPFEAILPFLPDVTRAPWEQRRRLMANDAFAGVVRDLADSFLLLVSQKPVPGTRRIFKFVFVHEARRRKETTVAWLFKRMGWVATRFDLDTPAAGKAMSYHCEVHAPAELEITRAELREGDVVRAEDAGSLAVAHLQVPQLQTGLPARAEVHLRSSRLGFLRPALFTALLTAGLLWGGRERLPQLSQATDAASTFLVLVPGLLAAYQAQRGEHELASLIRSGVRATLFVSGFCAVAAGGLLVARPRPDVLLFLWTILSLAATICVILLAIANVVPIEGKPSQTESRPRHLSL